MKQYFIQHNGQLSLTAPQNAPEDQLYVEFDPAADYSVFHKPKFNDEHNPTHLIESLTLDEIYTRKAVKALEIDLKYTAKITAVMSKHVEKRFFNPNYELPQITIDEIDALKIECNQEILDETGLTDYSYRQLNPKLATLNL